MYTTCLCLAINSIKRRSCNYIISKCVYKTFEYKCIQDGKRQYSKIWIKIARKKAYSSVKCRGCSLTCKVCHDPAATELTGILLRWGGLIGHWDGAGAAYSGHGGTLDGSTSQGCNNGLPIMVSNRFKICCWLNVMT